MYSLLRQRWLWITIIVAIAICLGGFIIVLAILRLPDWGKAIAVIALTIGWGIAVGYKDYLISKRHEEEKG